MQNNICYAKSNQISFITILFVVEFFFVIAAIMANYTIMATLSLFACFMALISFKNVVFHVNKFTIIFLLFIFYVLLRATIEEERVDVFFYAIGFIFTITIGNSKKMQCNENLLHWLKWFGLFFSLGVFLQFAFTDLFKLFYTPLFGPEYQDSINRQVIQNHMYTGWTSQTATTSLNIILGLMGSYLLFKNKKNKSEYLYALIMFISLLLVGKRGPTIFMILSFLLLYLLDNKITLKTICKFLFLLFIIFAFLSVGNLYYSENPNNHSRNFFVRLNESLQSNKDDVSNGRFTLWSLAIENILEKPLLGIGWRTYSKNIVKGMHAHNTFLQIFAETGILGLILYFLLIYYGIMHSIKLLKILPPKSDLIIGIKLSIMIQIYLILYNFSGNILYDYFTLLCIFWAYALYLNTANNYKRVIIYEYKDKKY